MVGDAAEGMFFFATEKEAYPGSAQDYARMAAKQTGNEVIMPVYLRIEKPLRLDSKRWYATADYYDNNKDEIYDKYFSGDYDGIIIEDSSGNDTNTVYLVDNNLQIKSATDNAGLFDPDNPDIRYSARDTAYQTNRQILAEALTTIAANESERKMLKQH